MNEDTTVNIDTTNDTETTVNNSLSAEERAQALEEQNKKLFARAKKAEGFIQDSNGNWVKRERPVQADISDKQTIPKPSDILKADEFKLYRQGYSESEIDLIMHNGGIKAIADEKSPLALGLKVAREQRKAEEASGQTSDKTGLSEIERKYTTEDMRNMKADDLANIIGYAN